MKLLKKVVSVATAFCVTAALTLTAFASPSNPDYTQPDGYFYQMNADGDLNAAPAHAQNTVAGYDKDGDTVTLYTQEVSMGTQTGELTKLVMGGEEYSVQTGTVGNGSYTFIQFNYSDVAEASTGLIPVAIYIDFAGHTTALADGRWYLVIEN